MQESQGGIKLFSWKLTWNWRFAPPWKHVPQERCSVCERDTTSQWRRLKWLKVTLLSPKPPASGIPRDGLQCTEHLKYMGTKSGLEKSAAIRPFATKKSRLASGKILLADSLATESCRLADRLATKLFSKRTTPMRTEREGLSQTSLSVQDARELAVRGRRSCLGVNPPPVSGDLLGAFLEILLPRPSELCGAEKIS